MESSLSTRWISTVASIWIQSTSGATLTFSIYSSILKSSQNYDQSTLDTVSVFKDIGDNAGILSGILYSAVTGRGSLGGYGGPWVVHLAGAVQGFIGYFMMWLAVAGVVSPPPVVVMCLYMLVAAHAQAFFNTANVVCGVQNFPEFSGTIVGILKGFQGLSAAILIQVYKTFCNGNSTSFILLLAILPSLITLVLMCFVKIYTTNERNDKKHLNHFSVIALLIAAYLMIIIILQNIITFPSWVFIITFTLLLLQLLYPLKTAITAQKEANSTTTSPLLLHCNTLENSEESMNILQAICTVNLWLLFTSVLCAMGSGLATINNISHVGESLNYTTIEINTLVSLWGIWNFLGRFGAGYVSDILLHRYGYARPLLMIVTLLVMTAGHVIIASGFEGNLYVGTILVGVCLGSQWALMPTITRDIYGVKHMGTIFNTISIGNPIGSYIFLVKVIGYLSDEEAKGSEGNVCYGTHCFMVSFFILGGVTFVGSHVAFALFFRTRRHYKLVVLKMFHDNL